MSKLPQVSGKDAIKAFRKIGFEIVQQRGSHVKLARIQNDQKQTIIIPQHKIIKKGTFEKWNFKTNKSFSGGFYSAFEEITTLMGNQLDKKVFPEIFHILCIFL